MKNLLLVEDDPSLGEEIRNGLAREGLNVLWAKGCQSALHLLPRYNFDLALLDLGLPDGSGFEIAREIKDTPVIFLSALNTAEHRLAGFELGGEEFIPKPFFLQELLLRTRKILERSENRDRTQNQSPLVELDGLIVDLEKQTLTLPGSIVRFPPPKELELLALLFRESPAPISRERIIEEVWRGGAIPRTIDNSILKLRKILGPEHSAAIHSVRGTGYCWRSSSQTQ